MMKRALILILATIILIAALPCVATAAAKKDESRKGWYTVDSVVPTNHTYSYIYDQPSSTNGKNLHRVNDGEEVYVYWVENGKWAYCSHGNVKGYIRWSNLSDSISPDSGSKKDKGWYIVDSVVPTNHTYSYIYDQPSSTNGKNLHRVNDGEEVYVYWVENDKWAYCSHGNVKGYIRWSNLVKSSK